MSHMANIMYIFWILSLSFIFVKGSLRSLDGKLPLLDGDRKPLYIDIDVTKFNEKIKNILTEDVSIEISDRFDKYITSDTFKEFLQSSSEDEIQNVSTRIIKGIFKEFVDSFDFKEELRQYADKILIGTSKNFTSSIEFREMVKIESKREVEELNRRTKAEIEYLNKTTQREIEDINKRSEIEIEVLKKRVETNIEDFNEQTKAKIKSLEKQTEKLMLLPHVDCLNVKRSQPSATDGVYIIRPVYREEPFSVYCDMSTDGGGWTVFQQRLDGSVDFYRNWTEYKNGFGNLNGEFWLGNDQLHWLTSSGQYELRIELGDWDHSTRYAEYSSFSIGDEASNYELSVTGYTGTAGNGFPTNNGKSFTTKDRDNDKKLGGNCAVTTAGAWWYSNCSYSNLNGEYLKGKHSKGNKHRGVNWNQWKGWNYSLKQSKMMIRRK